MTQEEYKSKKDKINKEHNEKLLFLAKQYAFINNPYKVGDIITDHIGSIKIEQINFYYSEFPSCSYSGIELTKKGEFNKRGKERTVFQLNIK
jgi:hypothetical protein